jgi:hypothetical protein
MITNKFNHYIDNRSGIILLKRHSFIVFFFTDSSTLKFHISYTLFNLQIFSIFIYSGVEHDKVCLYSFMMKFNNDSIKIINLVWRRYYFIYLLLYRGSSFIC